jgi:hypothetical protein
MSALPTKRVSLSPVPSAERVSGRLLVPPSPRSYGDGSSWLAQLATKQTHASVKHRIHRFYSILRCEQRSGLPQLIKKAAHPF